MTIATSTPTTSTASPLPRDRLVRGLIISLLLWIAFLLGTAYSSAATLLDRVGSTDVMRAASSGALQGRIALEVVAFVVAQLALHLVAALVVWWVAIATVVVWPETRAKFGRVVVGWFAVLAGAVLAYSSLWFPRTLFGAHYYDSLSTYVGPLHLGTWLYSAAVALAVLVTLAAFVRLFAGASGQARRRSIALASAVLGVGAGAVLWLGQSTAAAGAHGDKPNIIIIGIDSLRLEQLRLYGGTGITPNLDLFLAQSDVFKDTTTPAARTFSSWIAILTGRAPTITGARFNLAERSSVLSTPTIADVLRKSGYRTVYSTDEVRFANIDESYGFDQIVTPRIGASDFLIGTYNELPLASLVVNTEVGRWLFPFSYANRGVATTFFPETFSKRIQKEVEFDQPTLFISHLTAAHWPYHTAETPFGVGKPANDLDRPLYRIGLRTADRMFGQLLNVLRGKGALDNAIVVVLSDHGEALSLPSDSFFADTLRVEGMRAPIQMSNFGHGQSVLSQSQYQVLLGFRSFGRTEEIGVRGRNIGFPVTVEDIAPTLLDLIGVEGNPLTTTGQSLAGLLDGTFQPSAADLARIRFTETDLRVLPAQNGGIDEEATARQNSKFFEVDPKTARLHMRPKLAPLALAYKERAAYAGNSLLAAMPAGPYAHQYIFFDLSGTQAKLLLERPSNQDRDAQRLWDALQEHYRGELHRPVVVSREDWPRIGHEWETYIENRARADNTPAS